MRLAFFASGGGASLRAIVAAIRAGKLAAEPVLVIGNRKDAPALAFAREARVATAFIPTLPDPEAADARAAQALAAAGAEWVVLSGYLRKLGPRVLSAYPRRILNIHPALLPRHGGQGMYGRRVHEAVAAAGDAETGATIHLVDEEYDHGPPLAQTRIPVAAGESADSIEARVRALEPGLFVETLQRIAAQELAV